MAIVDSPHARRVTVLGATGSIGKNTVKLLEETESHFTVEALTAHRDVATLAGTGATGAATHTIHAETARTFAAQGTR